MCTYLKNMDGFTHNQLKNNSFDEVQKAFDKTMGWIDSFVSMDSEVVKGGKEKDEGGVTRAEESSFKRAGTELEQKRIKKQKIDDDQEEAEMKKHIEIVIEEEEIAVDAIPLATKSPIINIDKEDLETLWKVMFEPDVESEVWRNLQGYNVTVWKPFSLSGVHFVRFQNLHIFMLIKILIKKLKDSKDEHQVSGRIFGIKSLYDDLGVNTAKLVLLE
ncbi:hypothetical protein Tco_0998172 [Tanacetum coccineum]